MDPKRRRKQILIVLRKSKETHIGQSWKGVVIVATTGQGRGPLGNNTEALEKSGKQRCKQPRAALELRGTQTAAKGADAWGEAHAAAAAERALRRCAKDRTSPDFFLSGFRDGAAVGKSFVDYYFWERVRARKRDRAETELPEEAATPSAPSGVGRRARPSALQRARSSGSCAQGSPRRPDPAAIGAHSPARAARDCPGRSRRPAELRSRCRLDAAWLPPRAALGGGAGRSGGALRAAVTRACPAPHAGAPPPGLPRLCDPCDPGLFSEPKTCKMCLQTNTPLTQPLKSGERQALTSSAARELPMGLL